MAYFVDLMMELPEFLKLLLHDEAIELVVLRCELEGQLAQDQCEEDHS